MLETTVHLETLSLYILQAKILRHLPIMFSTCYNYRYIHSGFQKFNTERKQCFFANISKLRIKYIKKASQKYVKRASYVKSCSLFLVHYLFVIKINPTKLLKITAMFPNRPCYSINSKLIIWFILWKAYRVWFCHFQREPNFIGALKRLHQQIFTL